MSESGQKPCERWGAKLLAQCTAINWRAEEGWVVFKADDAYQRALATEGLAIRISNAAATVHIGWCVPARLKHALQGLGAYPQPTLLARGPRDPELQEFLRHERACLALRGKP